MLPLIRVVQGGILQRIQDRVDGDGFTDEEDVLRAAQDAAERLQRLRREVEPAKVALAGLSLIVLLGLLMSGWYWVLPAMPSPSTRSTCRTVDMSSWPKSTIPEAGRSPTSGRGLFRGQAGDELGRMSVFLDVLSSHSSVAGDDLEMKIVGYGLGELLATNVGFLDGLRGRKPSGNVASRRWNVGIGGIFRPHRPAHVALLMHERAGHPKRYGGLVEPWHHDQRPCPQAGRAVLLLLPHGRAGRCLETTCRPPMTTAGRRPSLRFNRTPPCWRAPTMAMQMDDHPVAAAPAGDEGLLIDRPLPESMLTPRRPSLGHRGPRDATHRGS